MPAAKEAGKATSNRFFIHCDRPLHRYRQWRTILVRQSPFPAFFWTPIEALRHASACCRFDPINVVERQKTVSATALHEAIRSIESISRRDPGGRGLAAHAESGRLLPAARELMDGERIIIVTGFCIRAAMTGETDGPPGALAVADALVRLGKSVVLLTDDFSSTLLAAGAGASGSHPRIATMNLPQDSADEAIDGLIADFAPTHVLAIERPGNAIDGHRYSMRGEMLDDLAASADRLLAPPRPRNYTTVAIGDGGNELGMGSLRDKFSGRINHGELIFSVTTADHVIAAGISNWGAYALAAALSLLSGRPLIRPPEHERVVLDAIVRAGAVDGCTRRCELSVDGLAWDDYARTLEDIYRETCSWLSEHAVPAVDLANRNT